MLRLNGLNGICYCVVYFVDHYFTLSNCKYSIGGYYFTVHVEYSRVQDCPHITFSAMWHMLHLQLYLSLIQILAGTNEDCTLPTDRLPLCIAVFGKNNNKSQKKRKARQHRSGCCMYCVFFPFFLTYLLGCIHGNRLTKMLFSTLRSFSCYDGFFHVFRN